MISLIQHASVKSVATNRTAHCKNCFDRKPIPPGEKRIIVAWGLGVNARTLYLCPQCAQSELESIEMMANHLKRAIAGWIDTDVEWEQNRLRLIQEESA